MSNISVIMVSYHTGCALWLAIDAALEQPECKELLLVNNGNPPGVTVRLRELAGKQPRLRIIEGQGNVGFAKGCNLGVKASGGEYVLLLNPDSMLPEGGLARAMEALKKYPENTLAGCYLVNPDGSEQRGCRRSLLTPKNAIAESLGFGGEKLNLHKSEMPEKAHEVPAISGAFMLLARSFYDRLGGLDEGYFLHMEDMDFCFRVHQAGGKVVCLPEIKVIHFRSTSEAAGRIVEKHKARGFIRYLKTHFSKEYSALLLNILTFGIWMRYWLKLVFDKLDRVFVPPLAPKRELARIVLLYRFARFGPRDPALMGKAIVVASGSGQVGLCAVGRALASGAQVIATYNRTKIPFSHPNLQWVQRDLLKPDPLEYKADLLIYTLSLWTLPPLLPGIFAAGTTRIVAYSSTSRFSKADSKSTHDREIVTKLAQAEEQVQKWVSENGGSLTILRPTMIYGVGLDTSITRLADVARRFGFLALHGAATGLRQPVQAQDLAQAALDASYNPATFNKAYNVGGGEQLPYITMVKRLFDYMGKPVRIFRPPMMPTLLDWLGKIYQIDYINGAMARRMNQDLVFDIQEAQNDFGYWPKGFLEGDVVI